MDTVTGLGDPDELALVCVRGPELGQSFKVGREALVIGRGGDVVLCGNDISRRHARLEPVGLEYFIEDLGSHNGTYVNGSRINERTQVRLGDRVQTGNTIFLFTQRDDLESRIERVQRLEALGTLAGGIAHDFNNALAVIMVGLDAVEAALPPDANAAHESMADIWNAARSAAALAKRLLRLGRTEPMTMGAVRIAGVVEGAVALAKRRGASGIKFTTSVEPHLETFGSHEELQQVMLNLYINAGDAMPNGGEISTTARGVTLDAGLGAVHQLTPGAYLELVVRDTGTGMAPEVVARAFEPFFSTKPRGKGTGLGLAMTHTTVRRHGGAIELDSKLGHGTTFRIWLPGMLKAPRLVP